MRSVPTADCSTCHGTGTAPGDGRTKCGFCDGVAPVVPSVDVIERARQLLDAATPGPWVVEWQGDRESGCYEVHATDIERWQTSTCLAMLGDDEQDRPDAALIAAAPALIGELCDHLEAARAALHECTTERDQLAAHLDSSPREPA